MGKKENSKIIPDFLHLMALFVTSTKELAKTDFQLIAFCR